MGKKLDCRFVGHREENGKIPMFFGTITSV